MTARPEPRPVAASEAESCNGVAFGSAEVDLSLVPQVTPWLVRFALGYARRSMARNLNAVRMLRAPRLKIPDDVPVVVFSNHAGWWDLMVGFYLTKFFLPKRTGYVPVAPWGFARYRILRRVGVFSVDPHSFEGAREFWRIAHAIMATPNTVLGIAPGGGFVDPRQRQVSLGIGLACMAREMERGILLPMAIEYPFWEAKQPEALTHLGEPVFVEEHPELGVSGWNGLLASQLEATQDVLAEQAIQRDPDRFEVLIRGASGRGWTAEAWRWLRGVFLGEAFRPKRGD